MRMLIIVLLPMLLCGCGGYELKNLAKSDIDLVADQFIIKTRTDVRELVVMLYNRNPDQLARNPGMTIEGRLAQLKVRRYKLQFAELEYKQDINAMNLAFDPNYRGDRVFALIVGLGSMLRQAYAYQPEMFFRINSKQRCYNQRPECGDVVVEAQKPAQAQWSTLHHYI